MIVSTMMSLAQIRVFNFLAELEHVGFFKKVTGILIRKFRALIHPIVTLVATVLLNLSFSAYANEVKLYTEDQSVLIQGELLSYENKIYRVSTGIGVLELESLNIKCDGEACPASARGNELKIGGSQELVSSLIPTLVEDYGKAVNAELVHSITESGNAVFSLQTSDKELVDASFTVLTTDTESTAIADGTADLVIASSLATQQSDNVIQAADATVFALEGLVIVTSQANPIESITIEDAARIFSGQITNWSEVGGRNEQIRVYSLDEATPTGSLFKNLIMDQYGVQILESAERMETDELLVETVSVNPSGIGFIRFGVRGGVKSLAIRGSCGIQTPANTFSIKAEEYPLTRRLFLYQVDNFDQGLRGSFSDYLGTEEVQKTIAQNGLVNQSVSSIDVEEHALRLLSSMLPQDIEVSLPEVRGMISDLIDADRMSLTLRFQTGSANLDARAEGDIARIIDQIQKGRFTGKEILLLGFTDSVGRGDLNQVLSQARANQVRDKILASLPADLQKDLDIRVTGYGEMMPLACNETSLGRRINRRVEVWTKAAASQ